MALQRLPKGQKPIPGWDNKVTTSGYGYRKDPFTGACKFHCGIDKASNGDGTFPWRSGKVVAVYANSGEIYIDHPQCKIGDQYVQSIYAHGKNIKVSAGQDVKETTKIFDTDSKGNVTGAHLHFGMRLKPSNQCIDPELYFRDWYYHAWVDAKKALATCRKNLTTCKNQKATLKKQRDNCRATRDKYLAERDACRKNKAEVEKKLAEKTLELNDCKSAGTKCQNDLTKAKAALELQKKENEVLKKKLDDCLQNPPDNGNDDDKNLFDRIIEWVKNIFS